MDTAPYKCHIFVCVNDRHGARKSCADGASPALRLALKERLLERGFSPKEVRVSQSLCLGLCEHGPNIVIYPQNLRLSAVGVADVERIVTIVETLLKAEG
jgi:(2Fe-2S) ferredoxin